MRAGYEALRNNPCLLFLILVLKKLKEAGWFMYILYPVLFLEGMKKVVNSFLFEGDSDDQVAPAVDCLFFSSFLRSFFRWHLWAASFWAGVRCN